MDSQSEPVSKRKRSAQLAQWREEGEAMVAAWRASGLSQAEYARSAGVNAGRLSRWARMLEQAAEPAETGGFVEAIAPGDGTITVDCGGGRCVRVEPGFDPAHLQAVVAALSAC